MATPSYRQLDAERIVATIETLVRRIRERFPLAGLNQVCEQLLDIGRQAQVRSRRIARPIPLVRGASVAFVGLIVASFAWTVWTIVRDLPHERKLSSTEFVQAIEAGFNAIVLIGATVLFLVTLENRVKRGRALEAVHELRSISHIIDMHQLTKDPERLTRTGEDTQSSPQRTMTRFELMRYLDYCSEMLSLVGKIGELYVQGFADSEAVAAVNDIEELTTSLSRKIWQKIMILHATTDDPKPSEAPQS